MKKIRWLKEAEKDFDSIFTSLENVSMKYAQRFYDSVSEIQKNLLKFPNLGRIVPEIKEERIREMLFLKYRLIYFIKTEDIIDILAIIHQSRDFQPTREKSDKE